MQPHRWFQGIKSLSCCNTCINWKKEKKNKTSRLRTLGTAEFFLRSGISALLGLLAFPSIGLAGAIPLPPTLLLAFRDEIASSLRSLSVVLVWLLFGYATTGGTDGPATKDKKQNKTQQPHYYTLRYQGKSQNVR